MTGDCGLMAYPFRNDARPAFPTWLPRSKLTSDALNRLGESPSVASLRGRWICGHDGQPVVGSEHRSKDPGLWR